MTAMLTPQIATQLREKAAKPGYWTGGCANWSCGNKVCEYVVADEYYASHEDARADGVEWGMRICRSCKRNVWPDALVLLKRERISLIRRARRIQHYGGMPPFWKVFRTGFRRAQVVLRARHRPLRPRRIRHLPN